jgi:phage terminase large subunit GpA-like protein
VIAVREREVQARQALRPPRRLKLSEWADEHFYLSAESAADPGRWKTIPYQREPMDAISDPTVEQVSFMKSARVGYTKMLNAAVGYHIHQDPCPVQVVQPTLEDASGYSKEEIAPMLRDCPVFSDILAPSKTRDSDNTILHKVFRGGSLSIVGANSGRGFRRVSRRVMAFDETDGYPLSAGVEGDPIKLGIRRTEYYWNRKIIAGSTPTLAGLSRIERLFLAGDQRRYYVPCTECGHMDFLVFRQETTEEGEPVGHFMHWPSGHPESAHFVCRECGGVIEHQDKRAIVAAGEWRAHAPFTGHASFHIWAAYSYSPNATWGQLAKEFLEANTGGPDQLKTFVNTVLGETWQEKGEAPEWERLYHRREDYTRGTCPDGVLFLTAAVDVQKNRLVYEVVGWGRGKESWSIDYDVIAGDTSDASEKGPWPQIDALLARSFPSASGANLTILRMAVDSGDQTQTVYGWARRHPLTQVIAVKGFPSGSAIVGAPSKVDVAWDGKRLKRGYLMWPVVGSIAKSELYGWLRLGLPTGEAMASGAPTPPGYCHFPEYGEEYFKQLTAEHLIRSRSRNGRVRMEWQPIPGRENHVLDCRVYARAAAAVVGLDRFKESDWRKLERHIGIYRRELPPGTEVERPGPVPPPMGASPAQPKKPNWIPRRPGSWLGGGR